MYVGSLSVPSLLLHVTAPTVRDSSCDAIFRACTTFATAVGSIQLFISFSCAYMPRSCDDVLSHSPAIHWSSPPVHIPTTCCLFSIAFPTVVRLCENIELLTIELHSDMAATISICCARPRSLARRRSSCLLLDFQLALTRIRMKIAVVHLQKQWLSHVA